MATTDSLYDKVADFLNDSFSVWQPRTVVFSTTVPYGGELFPALLLGHYEGAPYYGYALIDGRTHDVFLAEQGGDKYDIAPQPSDIVHAEPGADIFYIKALCRIVMINQVRRHLAAPLADPATPPEQKITAISDFVRTFMPGVYTDLDRNTLCPPCLRIADESIYHSDGRWYLNGTIEPDLIQAVSTVLARQFAARMVQTYERMQTA